MELVRLRRWLFMIAIVSVKNHLLFELQTVVVSHTRRISGNVESRIHECELLADLEMNDHRLRLPSLWPEIVADDSRCVEWEWWKDTRKTEVKQSGRERTSLVKATHQWRPNENCPREIVLLLSIHVTLLKSLSYELWFRIEAYVQIKHPA